MASQGTYQVRISEEKEDSDWDIFLAMTPGGDHVQMSLWAQVRAHRGWQAARVIVTEGQAIVAGAQLLFRQLPFFGAIGYVQRGPFLAFDDSLLTQIIINNIHQLAKAHDVQYLVLHPPYNGQVLADHLSHWGFRPSSLRLAPIASVIIDLKNDLDTILAQMKPKTRYNLHLGERKGVSVRKGTERDLPIFYRLYVETSERQRFSPDSFDYYAEMWRILSPRGHIQLFLAEHERKPVSALLAVSFGDTVTYKRGGWSGRYGELHPNEVMHWAVIKWAKTGGYRYYDLEGIDPQIARAKLSGHPNFAQKTGVTNFKLGFGGQIILFPMACEYVYNRLLGWAYFKVFPTVAKWPLVQNVKQALIKRIH